jgi:carbonic anhydrase/acetyltransferase-like protein (isoleucine patch superfamily)
MIVVSFGGKTPRVADSALVAETACLVGDVEVGENTSIWPGAVIRGDIEPIRIGSNCHVEDNSVLHGAVSVGDNSMIGHNCVVEGSVGRGTLVANGASILLAAEIGDSCLVAAHAVVVENTKVPDGSFVAGVPAKVKGQLTQSHIEKMQFYMPYYVGLVEEYKRQGIWSRQGTGD